MLGGVNVFGGMTMLLLLLMTELYRVILLSGAVGSPPNGMLFSLGGFAGYALLLFSGVGLLKQQAWGRTTTIAASLILLALPMLGFAFLFSGVIGVQSGNPFTGRVEVLNPDLLRPLFTLPSLLAYPALLLGAMYLHPLNRAPYLAVHGAVLEQDVQSAVVEEGNAARRIYQWLGGIHALAAFFALVSIGSIFSASLFGQTGHGSPQPMMMLPTLLMAVPTALQVATAVALLTEKRWGSMAGCIYAILSLLLGTIQQFAVYLIPFDNTGLPAGVHGYIVLTSLRSTLVLALLPIATYALLRRYAPAPAE